MDFCTGHPVPSILCMICFEAFCGSDVNFVGRNRSNDLFAVKILQARLEVSF